MTTSKRLALAIVFGMLIFVTKTVLPAPINKIVIVIHAFLLALGALLLGKIGATYVSVVGGILTAVWNVALAPVSFLFAVVYGLLVDGFNIIFKVNPSNRKIDAWRLIVTMTLSTALVGLMSYFMTLWMGLILRNFTMEIGILLIGFFSGAVAGYIAAIIWNKYLKNFKI
ncbi:hypothetical protein HXY32_04840 [Candidatus Bathyarchaeota archaeon]|nr:hypothetical protein [Candidatus Bathyarchaeota archaeon]